MSSTDKISEQSPFIKENDRGFEDISLGSQITNIGRIGGVAYADYNVQPGEFQVQEEPPDVDDMISLVNSDTMEKFGEEGGEIGDDLEMSENNDDNKFADDFEDDMMQVGEEIDNQLERNRQNHQATFSGFDQNGRPKKNQGRGGKINRGLTGQKKFGPNLYAPKDLNFLQSFVLEKFKDILQTEKIQDYRQVPEILNQQYCESILKFFFVLDQVPELNWEDGSQYMTLRCGKHFSEEATKYQIGNNAFIKRKDAENAKKAEANAQIGINMEMQDQSSGADNTDEMDEFKPSQDLGDSQCKLILKLKTTAEGFWKINECCDESRIENIYHDPPLVKTSSYYKKLRQRRSNPGVNVDAIFAQSGNQLYGNHGSEFEEEFITNEKTLKFNQELRAKQIQKYINPQEEEKEKMINDNYE